jgi:hypothetical protein
MPPFRLACTGRVTHPLGKPWAATPTQPPWLDAAIGIVSPERGLEDSRALKTWRVQSHFARWRQQGESSTVLWPGKLLYSVVLEHRVLHGTSGRPDRSLATFGGGRRRIARPAILGLGRLSEKLGRHQS